jgi:hypothetical protein
MCRQTTLFKQKFKMLRNMSRDKCCLVETRLYALTYHESGVTLLGVIDCKCSRDHVLNMLSKALRSPSNKVWVNHPMTTICWTSVITRKAFIACPLSFSRNVRAIAAWQVFPAKYSLCKWSYYKVENHAYLHYAWSGSRDISGILPRHPHFAKIDWLG